MDIINLSEAEPAWNWLHELTTAPEPLRWRHATTLEVGVPAWVPKPQSWRRMVAANRAATLLAPPSSLLVSHGPRMTMYGSLALAARFRARRHLAYAFNFTTLAMAPSTRRVMHSAFSRVDRFVVFSTMERRLYADFFDLDIASLRHAALERATTRRRPGPRPFVAGRLPLRHRQPGARRRQRFARAIVERLWDDAALNQRLAEQAQSFARLKCSEPSAVDYLEAYLKRAQTA